MNPPPIQLLIKAGVDENAARTGLAALTSYRKALDDNRQSALQLATTFQGLSRAVPGPGGELFRGIAELQRLPEQLKALSPSGTSLGGGIGVVVQQLGPLALGVVAFAGALKLLQDQVDANTAATKQFIADQPKVDVTQLQQFSFSMTATADSIAKAREQAELQITVLKQNADTYQQAINMASQQSLTLRAVDEIAYHNQQQYRDALDSTNKSIDQATKNLDLLNSQMIQNAAAAQDYLNGLQQYISTQPNYDKLIQSGNVQGVKDTRDALGRQISAEGTALRAGRNEVLGSPEVAPFLSQMDESKYTTISDELKGLEDVAGDKLPVSVRLTVDGLLKLSGQLDKDTSDFANLNENVLKAAEARRKEIDATQAFINNLADLAKTTTEIINMGEDRQKTLQRRAQDDQIAASRQATEKDYQQRIDQAKQDEAEQAARDKRQQDDEQSQTQFNDDKSKADQEFFDSSLKAYDNYLDSEKQATDRANLARLQTLEKAQLDLKSLAASGDVAGFVDRSNQAKLELKTQDQNNSLAEQQRRAQFDKETQAATDAHTKQLNDLNATLAKEKAAHDDAARQRIADIETQGGQANAKSTQLEKELQDLREQWAKDDEARTRAREQADYDERYGALISHQKDVIKAIGDHYTDQLGIIGTFASNAKNLLSSLLSGSPGPAASGAQNNQQSTPSALPNSFTPPNNPDINNLRFKSGLSYVPRDDFPALLHEGERVLTQKENQDYSAGRRGGDTHNYNVEIHAVVGDVAAKSYVDQMQDETIGGIKQALIQSKGRGSQ